jgi:steroid delta-isomerase-like uncharacterized protein
VTGQEYEAQVSRNGLASAMRRPGGRAMTHRGTVKEPVLPERPEAMVREIKTHLTAESSRDLEALLAGMTDDCYNLVLCDPSPLYQGPEAVARRYRGLWTAFPDLHVRLRRLVAIDGDLAVTEHTLSGTHGGPLFGVGPTGRPVQVETVVIWEFAGQRIRGETVYFDLATMLRQVGALALPGGDFSPHAR